MARPLKPGLDYFPHDTNAVNDEKLQALMAIHGAPGYSFYFIALERVFRTENGRIALGKPSEKAGLAMTMRLTLEQFEAILATALEVGAFDKAIFDAEHCLTSSGVQRRLTKVAAIREQERIRKESLKEKYKEKYKEKEKTKSGKRAENSRKTTTSEKEKEILIVPQYISRELWNGFLEMRKALKFPVTFHALKLAIESLEKLKDEGHDPVACLKQTIERGYRGIFPITQGGKNGRRNESAERADGQEGNDKGTGGKYSGIGETTDI